jgi:serine/threonine protein kinase
MSASAEIQPLPATIGPDSGRVLTERYELRDVCGSGGFSRVYQAFDRQLQKLVAVKLLDAVPTGVERQRFAREVDISASLVHPNLVRISDAGEVDGRPFAVMPLLHGRTLAHRRGADWRQVCRWMRQFLDGVRALHEARAFAPMAAPTRVLHRDIKPANCFVSDDGDLTILDFGLVKPLDRGPRITTTGTVLGTAAYMAPECLFAEPATQRSDVYSLGVTFFEMLTGELPYQGDLAQLYAHHVKREPPPSARDLRPELPADLAALVRTAMAPLPADRHDSVARMLYQLDRILRRIGDVAAPPPTPRPALALVPPPDPPAPSTRRLPNPPPARRSPLVALTLTAVALALAAVAVIYVAATSVSSPPRRDEHVLPDSPLRAPNEHVLPDSPTRTPTTPPAADAPPRPEVPATPPRTPPDDPPPITPARRPAPPRTLPARAAVAMLTACHTRHGVGEAIAVEVEVEVTPGGAVERAIVLGKPTNPETICMVDALKTLELPRGPRREVLRTTLRLAQRAP